jgi:prepilin-type N-terminal cleavage/methylation domain-containing protein
MLCPKTGQRSPVRSGFSLAEVLVAIALMSVILLALFGLVTAGVRQTYGGKKMTQGTVVARSVMERVNVNKPQDILGAVDTDTVKTLTWTKTSVKTGATIDSKVTPAAEGGTGNAAIRDACRLLLRDIDLPATAVRPATLTITMTARPSGKNFGNATMVQVLVDVTWYDWGTRKRQVRLQALNLRVVPS